MQTFKTCRSKTGFLKLLASCPLFPRHLVSILTEISVLRERLAAIVQPRNRIEAEKPQNCHCEERSNLSLGDCFVPLFGHIFVIYGWGEKPGFYEFLVGCREISRETRFLRFTVGARNLVFDQCINPVYVNGRCTIWSWYSSSNEPSAIKINSSIFCPIVKSEFKTKIPGICLPSVI